jgi:hypothetical protein
MGLSILSEALARIEHKIDQLLNHLKVQTRPMHFFGNACPVCKNPIEYIIDLQKNMVVRKCNCSTGKSPSIAPLSPLPTNAGGKSSGPGTSNEASGT